MALRVLLHNGIIEGHWVAWGKEKKVNIIRNAKRNITKYTNGNRFSVGTIEIICLFRVKRD